MRSRGRRVIRAAGEESIVVPMRSSEQTVLKVFISCPGDANGLAGQVRGYAEDYNREWSDHLGLRVEVWHWEKDAHSDVGVEPQEALTRQIPDYDLYLGLMWLRFGRPTKRAASGTEEEFLDALARRMGGAMKRPGVAFLFYDALPDRASRLDLEQLTQVQAFKRRVGNNGVLYREPGSADEFEADARLLLARMVQRRLRKTGGGPSLHPVPTLEEALEAMTADVEAAVAGMMEATKAILGIWKRMEKGRAEVAALQGQLDRIESGPMDMKKVRAFTTFRARFAKSMERTNTVVEKALPTATGGLMEAFDRLRAVYYRLVGLPGLATRDAIEPLVETLSSMDSEIGDGLGLLRGTSAALWANDPGLPDLRRGLRRTARNIDVMADRVESLVAHSRSLAEAFEELLQHQS